MRPSSSQACMPRAARARVARRRSRTQSKMRLTTSGGFFSALSLEMSLGVMLLSAASAASSAGCAPARSRSASSLTAAISCAARGAGHGLRVG